jgi:hypothetical protein
MIHPCSVCRRLLILPGGVLLLGAARAALEANNAAHGERRPKPVPPGHSDSGRGEERRILK